MNQSISSQPATRISIATPDSLSWISCNSSVVSGSKSLVRIRVTDIGEGVGLIVKDICLIFLQNRVESLRFIKPSSSPSIKQNDYHMGQHVCCLVTISCN